MSAESKGFMIMSMLLKILIASVKGVVGQGNVFAVLQPNRLAELCGRYAGANGVIFDYTTDHVAQIDGGG